MDKAKNKEYLNEILYKQQFKLKLSIYYLLLSAVSILTIFVLLLFMDFSFFIGISIYTAIITIYYKFFFAYTREGKQYEVFGYKLLGEFYSKIYKKIEKIYK